MAGALNVLAGGGSFLTLPILIFAGLPPTVANGTNRVAILLQNVTAVWGFDRRQLIDRRLAAQAIVPALGGALIGTATALVVGDLAFQRILAVLMIVIVLWSLWGENPPAGERRLSRGGTVAAFFAVGLYGGFVQAGVGFLLLAVLTRLGLDLVRGNALKVLVVLCFTPLSLGLFAWQGKVDWTLGLVLAAGNALGAWIGVHLTVWAGHRVLRVLVTAAILVFAVVLFLQSG